MKKNRLRKRIAVLIAAVTAAALLTGCGKPGGEREGSAAEVVGAAEKAGANGAAGSAEAAPAADEIALAVPESLEVRFGDDGDPFVMKLENNATAAAIAEYVGTADWRLPIYHYDDYENWEVMQYYDVPSRYEIPSAAETVTLQKAGEVYYSEPNRIILFYQDGQVAGEYTKIGTIEDTEKFREAVVDNPVLEGWGNKIVRINSAE